MREQFNEDNYATPRYKISMVRVPMARPGAVYSKRKIRVVHTTPTTDEIYEFAHQLFKKVQAPIRPIAFAAEALQSHSIAR